MNDIAQVTAVRVVAAYVWLAAAAVLSCFTFESAHAASDAAQSEWRDQSEGSPEMLLAQAGGTTGGRQQVENPPGFYVPVRPTYEDRTWTIRGAAFMGNQEMFSLILSRSRHPTLDIELGVFANPYWCSRFIDNCEEKGVPGTAVGASLKMGISRPMVDQRGVRDRPWSFEVPFYLELNAIRGGGETRYYMGLHTGFELVRWFQPNVGFAMRLIAGSPLLEFRSGTLLEFDFQLAATLGVTF